MKGSYLLFKNNNCCIFYIKGAIIINLFYVKDVGKTAPSYLRELKSIGVAFPDWIPELISWKFPSEFDAEFQKWVIKKNKKN